MACDAFPRRMPRMRECLAFSIRCVSASRQGPAKSSASSDRCIAMRSVVSLPEQRRDCSCRGCIKPITLRNTRDRATLTALATCATLCLYTFPHSWPRSRAFSLGLGSQLSLRPISGHVNDLDACAFDSRHSLGYSSDSIPNNLLTEVGRICWILFFFLL